MFLGHYGVAFAAKRIAPRTSLGALTFAELADIWAFTAYHLGMQVRPTTAVVQ